MATNWKSLPLNCLIRPLRGLAGGGLDAITGQVTQAESNPEWPEQ